MPRIIGKLTIDNSIHELRHLKNITQQELAEAVDVTRATIIALEKGSYNPSLESDYCIAICHRLYGLGNYSTSE